MQTDNISYRPAELEGRSYCPTFPCFLAPDNHFQSPDFSQIFNCNAYRLNGPLKYPKPCRECMITTGIITKAAIGNIFYRKT